MNCMANLELTIKEQAHALGFELAGIAPATPADCFERLRDWLDRGFAGEMEYMHRHVDARRKPSSILPEVRSVVMVGMNYAPGVSGQGPGVSEKSNNRPAASSLTPDNLPLTTARVARYAHGADYHDVMRQRLKQLLAWVQLAAPGCRGRGVVDTAPLLERDFARRAGLGWFGKNTMLIHKRLGSYFFLGALLLDLELTPDPPHLASHCGSCTACLDACPTNAFAGPGWLDSRRCISYLTIELRGPVPTELRSHMGDWLFGCDICQEVCPWNRKAPPGGEPLLTPRPELESLDPIELLSLSEEEFPRRFRGTALLRPRRSGLLRNAALFLGNQRNPAALPALERALTDADPVVREAAEWAIAEIRGQESGIRNQG